MWASEEIPARSLRTVEEAEIEEVVIECASCLEVLTEDTVIEPVCEGGDGKCLSCSAEEDAAYVVLAEVRPHLTPTRTVDERARAVAVMEKVIARAKKRIAEEQRRLALARVSHG